MTKEELKKENAQLKSKNCWKTCEYAEPKSQWISQHIQDVVQLTKAKEILEKLLEEEKNNMYWKMDGSDKSSYYEVRKQAEQFISEVEK